MRTAPSSESSASCPSSPALACVPHLLCLCASARPRDPAWSRAAGGGSLALGPPQPSQPDGLAPPSALPLLRQTPHGPALPCSSASTPVPRPRAVREERCGQGVQAGSWGCAAPQGHWGLREGQGLPPPSGLCWPGQGGCLFSGKERGARRRPGPRSGRPVCLPSAQHASCQKVLGAKGQPPRLREPGTGGCPGAPTCTLPPVHPGDTDRPRQPQTEARGEGGGRAEAPAAWVCERQRHTALRSPKGGCGERRARHPAA